MPRNLKTKDGGNSSCEGRRCCEGLRSELHYSKVGLCCEDSPRTFYYSPWFPRYLKWQLLFLLYRWVIAIYFLCWFVVIIKKSLDYIKWKYLIYISNWAYVIWLLYLLFSAISLSVDFLWQLLLRRSRATEKGCCSQKHQICQNEDFHDNIDSQKTHWMSSLAVKIQWLLFTVGTEFAVAITLLYWTLFYQPRSEHNFFSLDSLHIHLINGVVALVDLWLSGTPVRLYHCLYSVLFAASYFIFTVIYYAAGGMDPAGNRFIYPFLNYKSNPVPAVGIGIGCALVMMTAIHFVFYLQFIVRNCITCHIHRKYYSQATRKLLMYTRLPLYSSGSDLAL